MKYCNLVPILLLPVARSQLEVYPRVEVSSYSGVSAGVDWVLYMTDANNTCSGWDSLEYAFNSGGFGDVTQASKPTSDAHKMSHDHVDLFQFTEILAVDSFGEWIKCDRGGEVITAEEVFSVNPFHEYFCHFFDNQTLLTTSHDNNDHGPIFNDFTSAAQWMWRVFDPCSKGAVKGHSGSAGAGDFHKPGDSSDGLPSWWWYGRNAETQTTPLEAYSISSSHTVNEAGGFVIITRKFGTDTKNARTELLDKDCRSPVTRVISTTNTAYEKNEVTSTIQVNVNEIDSATQDNILFDINGNEFAADADNSLGTMKFCLVSTSITSWGENDIDMTKFRGLYSIGYKVVDDFVVINSVTESDMDQTDDLGFEIELVVNAQRCSEDSATFTGSDPNATLVEGDVYYLCLNVLGGTLSNINLLASYSEINDYYSESLPLVVDDVVVNPIFVLSDIDSSKQIAVPIISEFLEGVVGSSGKFKLSGDADIAFLGSRGQKAVQAETYEVIVELGVATELGCLQSLFLKLFE